MASDQQAQIERRLTEAFEANQARALAEVIQITYNDLVKADDFNELKAIVRQLAEAQNRTEQRLEELAQAQARTEQRLEELAQAQARTEQSLRELTSEVRMLVGGLSDVRAELGGLSRSTAYALENEAYRLLPAFLLREHGIEVVERLLRTEIGGEEINLFGKARQDGREVLLVGETKLQLDERRANRRETERVLDRLAAKVEAVKQAMPGTEVVPLLITHYARPAFVEQARARGIIVVQSYEW